jgi:hypothetical protein
MTPKRRNTVALPISIAIPVDIIITWRITTTPFNIPYRHYIIAWIIIPPHPPTLSSARPMFSADAGKHHSTMVRYPFLLTSCGGRIHEALTSCSYSSYAVGNKVFRNAVSVVLEDFINAVNRFEKALVVQRVVESVQSRGGRFLKEDTRQGGWYQLSEQQSKEKVGHAIRDAANLYEVRKQKEKIAQTTPQLRNTGESDDEHRKPPEWRSYARTGGDESSVDYGVSSRGRGSISMSSRSSAYTPTDYHGSLKRRGAVVETTDYQPQRKRRRASSPTYYSSTMALSDQFLSTPSPPQPPRHELEPHGASPSSLRQSPLLHATSASNVVSSGSMTSPSRAKGVVLADVPSSLRRSPIAPAGSEGILPPPQYVHHFTVYDPKQQSTEAASSPEEEPPPTATSAYSYPHPSWGPAHPHSHRGSIPILPPFYDERSYVQPHRYRSYPHAPPPGSHLHPPPYPAWTYRAPPAVPHRGWVADPYDETGGSYEEEESGDGGDSVESPSRSRQRGGR